MMHEGSTKTCFLQSGFLKSFTKCIFQHLFYIQQPQFFLVKALPRTRYFHPKNEHFHALNYYFPPSPSVYAGRPGSGPAVQGKAKGTAMREKTGKECGFIKGLITRDEVDFTALARSLVDPEALAEIDNCRKSGEAALAIIKYFNPDSTLGTFTEIALEQDSVATALKGGYTVSLIGSILAALIHYPDEVSLPMLKGALVQINRQLGTHFYA